MQFTFNEEKHELTVEDNGAIRRFILYDNLWEITYLILKAIDQLDNGVTVEVADWAKPDSQIDIPTDKLDTGTDPGQVVTINDNGVIDGGLNTVLADGDTVIFHGGTASGDV